MNNWTSEDAEKAQSRISTSRFKTNSSTPKDVLAQTGTDLWTQEDIDHHVALGGTVGDKKITTGQAYAEKVRASNLHSKRGNPKTATTVVAKPERASGAATGRPQRKKNPEYNIQKEFVRRMFKKYPHILIFSDAAAHVAKSMIQQVRANALQSPGQKWPDVFVAQPSGDYAGLFLEFKAETPYKMDGVTLKNTKDDHTEKQRETMERLTQRGYQCWFVWTVEQAMDITEKYLNL